MTQSPEAYQADVIIIGAGISGIVTAIELLNANKKVLILDRDEEKEIGGLAKWSFGGMFFADSPVQRKAGIKDSVDLALKDWLSFAEFDPTDEGPKKWAEQFVSLSTPHIHNWLVGKGISFFPVLNWVERGLFKPGNSLPRFHMVFGTGWELAKVLSQHLLNHPKLSNLQIHYEHRVKELEAEGGRIVGVSGENLAAHETFSARGDIIVVATGGINGNIEKLKENWYKPWGKPPEIILNGAHPYALGDMHEAVEQQKGSVIHLDRQWNYAAGVHHPNPRYSNHGLSLVPPKSALWVNYQGERFGPMPLITAYDTRFLVEQICKQPVKYSWQILNHKIMMKEFAISGSEHNEAMRDKKRLKFIMTVLMGNKKLVKHMLDDCKDFIVANSVEELAEKMNELTGEGYVEKELLADSIRRYDEQIDRGPKYFNDEQLRRIAHARQYRGDRMRTSKFQKIDDPKARPLIAIREFILSRKSLGGIETDLQSRVLSQKDVSGKKEVIEGLYAVGEAAGFGGGNVHGHRALEGTFLSGCVLSARVAAYSILGKTLS
ncbi:MAG: FAD-binding dehydrogenase [Bacteroidota bacterium]